MPKTNLFVSLMRTGVPLVAGALLALAARAGLTLDDAAVAMQVQAALTAGYYAVFRLIEEAAGRIGVPWLRAAAGVALGWARPPQYGTAVYTEPVRVRLDTEALARDVTAALHRASRTRGV